MGVYMRGYRDIFWSIFVREKYTPGVGEYGWLDREKWF